MRTDNLTTSHLTGIHQSPTLHHFHSAPLFLYQSQASRDNDTMLLGNEAESLYTREAGPQERHLAEYEELYLRCQFVTGLILYPVCCVFGLTGNVLSLCVLSHRKMKSSTNTYLQALAVSDSIKLLNDFAYFLTILFLNIHPKIGNLMFGYLYPYAHYFFNMSVCVTAWITVSVAAERYILVCHATKAKRLCNIDRSRVISISVFILIIVVSLPLAVRYKTVTIYDPALNMTHLDVAVTSLWRHEQFARVYTWFHHLLRSIIPLALLTTLNGFIITALWRASVRQRKRHLAVASGIGEPSGRRQDRAQHSRQRISLMLVAVIILFLVCVTPDTFISIILGHGYYESSFLVRAIREITDFLLLLNSALNFVLYCIFNRLFRKRFLEMFCGCTKASRQMIGQSLCNVSRDTTLCLKYNGTVSCTVNNENGPNMGTMLLDDIKKQKHPMKVQTDVACNGLEEADEISMTNGHVSMGEECVLQETNL